MRYRYLVDFRHGISVFVNFSYGIAVLGTPQCPPRQSQIDNLFVKSVHTTQYGIRSLGYAGPKLWNSLFIDVKKIKPFSSFRQHFSNSLIIHKDNSKEINV